MRHDRKLAEPNSLPREMVEGRTPPNAATIRIAVINGGEH